MEDRVGCSRLVSLNNLFNDELSWLTHLRPGSGDVTMPVESKIAPPLNNEKNLITFKLSKEGALIKTNDSNSGVEGKKKGQADKPKNVMDVWKKPYGWFFLPGEKITIVE